MSFFSAQDGTQLYYSEVGHGPRLVCVPGGPGRAADYLEDLAGLSEIRTLVLFDPRAVGHSEVPSDPSTLRCDRVAQDLEALREHLGLDTLDVLGHSAGAIVAQAWACTHRERVSSLVLVTPSDALQGGNRADVQQIRELFCAEPWFADAMEALAALEDAPRSQQATLERATRPFFYGRWDERTQEHAAGADRQSSKRALLGFWVGAEEVDDYGILAGLKRVTAPVLVIGAQRDALTGVASVQLVADCFSKASTAIIPGAGHFPWVDEPQGFRDAVSGPHLAVARDHRAAAVVQRRPARRQPGPHRPDGRRAQAPDVRPARRAGLQGDRGRLPGREPDRLRLHPPLVEDDLVPDDVTIQVLTQAREELIERTCESLVGFRGTALIHLYNSTSTLQRRVVFGLDKAGIKDIAVRGAQWCEKYAESLLTARTCAGSTPRVVHRHRARLRAVEVCEAVMDVWQPTPERPVVLNLPATVEMATPNVYADQIEWFGRNVSRRDASS